MAGLVGLVSLVGLEGLEGLAGLEGLVGLVVPAVMAQEMAQEILRQLGRSHLTGCRTLRSKCAGQYRHRRHRHPEGADRKSVV